MVMRLRNTMIVRLDILTDDHGSVTFHPDFSSNAGVFGTGREPNALTIASILKIANCSSFRAVEKLPVRIIFNCNTLVAIGHYSEDQWCYLPSGGKIISLKELKELEKESSIELMDI